MPHHAKRWAGVVALYVTASLMGNLALAAQRETPPALGPAKEFRLPAKREFTLPNGMAVTLIPFGTVPKAAIRLVMRVGGLNEGANEVWLSGVTGDMMSEGTATLTASQIAERVAGFGGELRVTAGADLTNIGGQVLAERTADMVKLVADVALHPSFPEAELQRVKANRARDLAIEKSQPQSEALERFQKTLYGDHPYGRVYPTDTLLASYTLAQVRDFYTRNYGAARAHLYVAGVFDAAAVERAAKQSFGGWAKGSAPKIDQPRPSTTRSLALLDRPNAVQSTVLMGLPVQGPTTTEFTALQVTDALLGGTFASRITTNIREAKGYTYSPFSQISTRYHDAYWAEQADVTTNVTGASLKEIFGEIDRLTKAPPGDDELTGIKRNMIGLFTLQNSSRSGIINQLGFVDLQGLSDTYLTQYAKRVNAVTPAEVQRIMSTQLRPDEMTIVVVGDKKTVESQVAPFVAPVP